MISKQQLEEIKNHLEESQNPLFFFDNDVDGLCTFLILRRAIGRGKGIPIKSFPDLKEQYVRKVEELNPDKIFILDKAEVEDKFINAIEEKNIPIIWIDHHETKTDISLIEKTHYYNSLPTAEPTTYIAQKVFNRREDLWLALIGCIGDVYMPEFAKEFQKESPELINSNLTAFQALYKSEIGKIVRILNFGLMDSTTNVVNLIKYLFKAKNVYDIIEENHHTKSLHKRYNQLSEFYNKQVEKAKTNINRDSNHLIFSYAGNTSMSSEIANKLYFEFPEKLIVVAYKRPEKINISIRGKNALEVTKKAIENIPDSTGGGHAEATGAMIPVDKWDKFKNNVKGIVKNI
ncbi:MAG: DHHA1 domain-containing protein [archaeon]